MTQKGCEDHDDAQGSSRTTINIAVPPVMVDPELHDMATERQYQVMLQACSQPNFV